MTKFRTRAVVVFVFILCIVQLSHAGQPKTYFVQASGDNSNSGLTVEKPLKSVNAAIRKASAGDTIYVLPGTYRELISFSGKKGIPEHPICLMGYSATVDDYPVIDGGAVEPSSDATYDWMNITDSEWIEISRLKFKNGWTFPVKVVRSSYLTFRSCHFWGGKRVINATTPKTHHILVEDCFWDQGGEALWKLESDKGGVDAWTSMHHGAMAYFNGSLIDFHGTGGSMVIRRNTVLNAFQAFRYRGDKGNDSNVEIYENHVSNMRDNDFEPEYYTFNLHIYHNVSHNIHRTLSVDNVEGGQIYYYGNVITADTDPWTLKVCTGLWKVYGRERYLSYPIYAFNNSFYAPGIAFHYADSKATLLRHFNNAYFFLKDGRWDLSEWDATDEFDHDLSNRPWPSNIISHHQEAHGIIGDVKFADPEHGDLRLRPGSAAIDAGKVASLKEYGWTQSFHGQAPDIGAYEDGSLVEGPPFRFMVPPEGKISYAEKPRIVRHKREGSKIILYFSEKLEPTSVKKTDIELREGIDSLEVISASFPHDNYELVIETKSVAEHGEVSLSFKHLPVGMNGEQVTYWASTIRIQK